MILDGLYILFAGFIGFGCGLVFAARMFRMTIESKADTGIRLECNGMLYVIHSVRFEGEQE